MASGGVLVVPENASSSQFPNSSPAATPSRAAASLTAPTSCAVLRFWMSFVYIDRSTTQFSAVQFGNGLLGLVCICHLDKPKAARTPCITICHERHPVNLPERFKQLTQLVFASSEVEVPDKDVFHEISS